MENPPQNLDTTKYVPMYFLVDTNSLPQDDGYLQTFIETLGEAEKKDFMFIDRAAIEPKVAVKKAPAKGKEVEEVVEDLDMTIAEGMTTMIEDLVNKECAAREKVLYEERRAFLAEHFSADPGQAGKKDAKGAAAPAKKAPPPVAKKGAPAPKSAKAAPKSGTRPGTSEGEEENDDKEPPKLSLPQYPATLPMHVLLVDIARKPKDVIKLKEEKIEIATILQFKPHGDKSRGQNKDGVDLEEFIYKPDTAYDIIQGEEEQPGAGNGKDLGEVAPAESKEAEKSRPPSSKPAAVTLLASLIELRNTNATFRDLHVLEAYLPDPAIALQPGLELVDAKTDDAKGKAGPKSGKGKGKGEKELTPEERNRQKLAAALAGDCEVVLRRFSGQRDDFIKWRQNATVQPMPKATPAEAVDMRLYDSLLSKVSGTCISVSGLLHCMFEQVAITAQGADLSQMFTDEKAKNLADFLDGCLASVLAEDLIEETKQEAVVNKQDNAGGPCQFKNGVCTACGQPEQDDDVMSEGEMDGSYEDATDVASTLSEQLCPATIGEPHFFINGKCAKCFTSQNQKKDTESVQSEQFCPATVGDFCDYMNGQCTQCGCTDFRTEGKGLILPSDSIHRNKSREGQPVSKGNFDEMDVTSTASFCPATMGDSHVFRSGFCANCGQAPSNNLNQTQQIQKIIGSEPTPMNGTQKWSDEESLCPATMGEIHEFQDGQCTMCGFASANNGGQGTMEGQQGEEGDQFATHEKFRIGERGNNWKDRTGTASKTSIRSDRSAVFCPATLGGVCELNANRECMNCGQIDRTTPAIPIPRICPATLGAPKAAVKTVVVKYGNERYVNQAKDCLAHNLQWTTSSSISMDKDALEKQLPLPGVNRVGMPTPKTRTMADRGIQKTALLNRSTLPPDVFEFGLLALVVEEMLVEPAPAFCYTRQKHTEFFHVDHTYRETRPVEAAVRARLEEIRAAIKKRKKRLESGELEKELDAELQRFINIVFAPHVSKTKPMNRLKLVGAELAGGKAPAKGAAKGEAAVVEAVEEKKENPINPDKMITIGPLKGDEEIWIGEKEDEEVEEARIKWSWNIRDREYREEFSPDVLPQILSRALMDPTNTVHCQARYEPLDDTLIVTCHSRTPLTRERTIEWEDYISPNLNIRQWLASDPKLLKKPATNLYDYANNHEGLLKRKQHVMYPRDGGKMGLDLVISGRKRYPRLFLQKDQNLVYVQPNKPQATMLGPPRISTEQVPNVVNAFFPDQSSVTITYVETPGDKGEGGKVLKPVVGYTCPNGMILHITEDGKVYMQYPKPILPEPVVATTPVPEVGETGETDAPSDEVGGAATSTSRSRAQTPVTKASSPTPPDDLTEPIMEDQVEGSPPINEGPPRRPKVRTEESLGFGSQGEQWRCLNSNGVVMKKMVNGVTHMLMPDGNISTFDPDANAWVITNNDGVKVVKYPDGRCKELKHIQIATQYDPESGADVISREDLTMFIKYRSGSSVAQLSDATRIYTDVFSTTKKRFVVECPDFPAVSMDVAKTLKLDDATRRGAPKAGVTGRNLATLDRRNQTSNMEDEGCKNVREVIEADIEISLSDGTIIKKRSPQGSVSIIRRDGSRLVACPQGKVIYTSKQMLRETLPVTLLSGEYEQFALPKESYTIDVCLGRISVQDNEENTFEANLNGKTIARLSRDEGLEVENRMDAKYYPPPENPLQPRVFVVRGDGSGYELLSNKTVQEYMREVAVNSNARILPCEQLTGPQDQDPEQATDETQEDFLSEEGVVAPISIKFLEAIKTPLGYNREIEVPNCIKATPSGLTSEPKPSIKYFIYRHLIRYPQLTEDMYNIVKRDKASYESSRLDQLQADLDFEVDDTRSKEEREEEERLALEVITARSKAKERALQAALDQHEQSVQNTARDKMTIGEETMNLTATITATYDPPKKTSATTAPFSKQGEDGAREAVKFFSNKPGAKPKVPKNPHVAAGGALNATSVVAGIPTKTTDHPEFGQFFLNPTFDQRFGLASIFTDLELAVHPLARPGMTPSELAPIMKALNRDEKESINDEHLAQLRAVVEGIRQVMSCINRIFIRPHDPTLRTIALSQPPYRSILQSTPKMSPFVEPILNALGFESKLAGSNGVMVQMKDDLYLRDGMKALVQHLKAVSEGSGAIASLGKQLIPPRAQSAKPADSSDDEEADNLEVYNRPESAEHRLTKAEKEREARFKAASQYPHVHEPHGASFSFKSKFEPQVVLEPKSHERSQSLAATSSSFTNVAGSPRHTDSIPQLPQSMQPKAMGDLNLRYISREAAVKRKVRTTSTVRVVESDPTASFADFMLHPSTVDFGTLLKGSTYRVTCAMTNVGFAISKFQVRQPVTDAGSIMHLKVLYRPGDVAPGMKKRLEVQLYAGNLGEYNNYIQILTEKAVYNLPVSANVVNEIPVKGQKSRRSGTASPHVPPLNTSVPTAGRFGQTGQVRLHSELPSPTTQMLLSQIGGGQRPHSRGAGSRPGSGASNDRPLSATRRSNQPGSDRPLSKSSAREPTIPSIDTKYKIDPNRTLQQLRAPVRRDDDDGRI